MWTPVLAALFTYIENIVHIDKEYGYLCPNFFKDFKKRLQITIWFIVQNSVSKMNAKRLYEKLYDRIKDNILAEQQARFRQGRNFSGSNNDFVSPSREKYNYSFKILFHRTFIDVKSVFDSVFREKLMALLEIKNSYH